MPVGPQRQLRRQAPILPARVSKPGSRTCKSVPRLSSGFRKTSAARVVTSQAAFTPLLEPLVVATGLPIATICHVTASCVIAGACVRNVPQLIQCWKERSTEGISLWALVTEVSCYAASVAYGSRQCYPCTMWAADLACWAQDSILITMIAVLNSFPAAKTIALVAAWLGVQGLLFTQTVPMWALAKFQILTGLVLGLGARMPQIVMNFKEGHTGMLNPATFTFNAVSNALMGTIAAIMTADLYVIGTQVWMFVLNCIVLGQILLSKRAEAETEQLSRDKVRRPSYDDATSSGEFAHVRFA